MELKDKKCVPCEGGTKPMNPNDVKDYLSRVKGWRFEENKIKKLFTFVNFRQTLNFVNKVGEIAENEGHHPDLYVSYGHCEVILWTHAINGLSENDFILAAKIDEL